MTERTEGSSRSSLSGRRVLVTEGAGFLGPTLCRALSERGAWVYAVSRQVEPGEENGVLWLRADFSNLTDVETILTTVHPEVVFHLAEFGNGRSELDLVVPTFESNLASTVNLLTTVARQGPVRVILAGSMEEPLAADEVASSPYAVTKWASSQYSRMFHALYNVSAVIARIFMAYGPGYQDQRKLLPFVIRSLLQGKVPELPTGERAIDWIFVEDVVEGLLRLAEADGLEGETVDLGSGELITVRRLVERVVDLVGSPLTPRFGTVEDRPFEMANVADAEATFRLLGWRPPTPLTFGLQKTIAWHTKQLAQGSANGEKSDHAWRLIPEGR